MLERLVGHTCKFEKVGCASGMSLLDPCAFHARSYYNEQFMEPCTTPSQSHEYVSPLCISYQSSEHNTNSCPRVISMASTLE